MIAMIVHSVVKGEAQLREEEKTIIRKQKREEEAKPKKTFFFARRSSVRVVKTRQTFKKRLRSRDNSEE